MSIKMAVNYCLNEIQTFDNFEFHVLMKDYAGCGGWHCF